MDASSPSIYFMLHSKGCCFFLLRNRVTARLCEADCARTCQLTSTICSSSGARLQATNTATSLRALIQLSFPLYWPSITPPFLSSAAKFQARFWPTMEPVSASIGLAASLVTLIEVAGKSYSALSKFTHRMKHAPKNIQKLCSQVTSLQSLLSIIQGFVDQLRVEDISPELRSLWNSKMSSIRDDLDTLGEQAEKLNLMLNGGTHATWRARLKKVLSDEDIARYKHLLQNYIHDLQLIEAHFKR